MNQPSNADAFEVLCLQAAADGRKEILFGDSVDRARQTLRPFFVGSQFPSVYLEYPLIGDPFLDVTLLYEDLERGLHIPSDLAQGTDAMLDWYAVERAKHEEITCGFEVDVKNPNLQSAAIHFQPRHLTELVRPFCQTISEEARGELYLDLAARMPQAWQLSFFGMFRGRPGSPLRVCGYLSIPEQQRCAKEPDRIRAAFDQIGFTAYDDELIARVATLFKMAPSGTDFQFDVLPDGSLGETLGIDFSFAIRQPHVVRESFESGVGARCMELLQSWGAADDRWHLAADASFARSIPVVTDDGELAPYGLTLLPQWVKARWTACQQQPSKLYYLGSAGILDDGKGDK